MEAGYLPVASTPAASQKLEIVPVEANFRLGKYTKLSSAVAMRFLSVAISLVVFGIAGQALALQKVGSNGAEVAKIQSCLKKLGYFQGPVNGNFGSITERAVIAFQQAQKLTADGVVGTGTQRSLQQACQTRSGNTRVSTNLQPGSRGPEVIQLQQRLQRLGYFQGPITGYFGPQTQQALLRSQQSSRTRTNPSVPRRTPQATANRSSVGGPYPVLSEGSQGTAVTRLQQRLQQLGYLNTNPTGNFGPLTRNALIAFQRNSGIAANGVADPYTWNRLLNSSSNNYPDALPTVAPAALPPVIPTTNFSAVQVRELQEQLRDIGYLKANPTGNFGPMTRDALIQFQRDYQLTADGIADPQTLAVLRSVWQNRYANQNQPARNYLTIGDSGENVRAVQERLLQLGFFNTNPDGYYGENTRAYVYAFQQYSRLNPTGNVDGETWQALGLSNANVGNTAIAAANVNTNANQNRYVVVIPIHNAETFNKVSQYITNPVVEKSRLGDYVNAGRFSSRAEAENLSKLLRSYGLDARVEYF